MATTMKLIAKSVLGSNAADVTFSSIPGTYTDLVIVASVRSTWTDPGVDMLMRFNSDSGSNYTNRRITGNGSTAGSDSTGSVAFATPGVINGAGSTASTFASVEIYIPNYAGSTNKSWSSTSAFETNATAATVRATAGLWSNTAAITTILLYSNGSGANLVSGTSVFLYGITKS